MGGPGRQVLQGLLRLPHRAVHLARLGRGPALHRHAPPRLDLHGLRQRDAHARLRAFLLEAHADGLRTVLVITGKGGEEQPDRLGDLAGERQRGVLRRNVPHWLEEPELRAIVLSFTLAGVRHGGAGALYVQLRKGSR